MMYLTKQFEAYIEC